MYFFLTHDIYINIGSDKFNKDIKCQLAEFNAKFFCGV